MKKEQNENNILLAENKKARFNYSIEDTFECGLVLLGAEVKSIRERKLNFADAYALVKNGEVFVIGLRIDKYKQQTTHEAIDPDRTRKLLLNKKEIKRIVRLLQNQNTTLVPLKLYLKNGKVKLLLGLAIGKSKSDKRHTIKDREAKIEISRALKRG